MKKIIFPGGSFTSVTDDGFVSRYLMMEPVQLTRFWNKDLIQVQEEQMFLKTSTEDLDVHVLQ